MLKLTIKPGEYLQIGEDIKVIITGGSANNIRILVDAPADKNIVRSKALEKYANDKEKGFKVRYHKEKELSSEAKQKIKSIIVEDKKKDVYF